jgi:DNA gyrase subunit A
MVIRTRVADVSLIGRNTQGVRLIRVEDGDSVGSLAKLPEEELTVDAEALDGPAADAAPRDGLSPHILDDGVGEAEASDHIDDTDGDGEPDA